MLSPRPKLTGAVRRRTTQRLSFCVLTGLTLIVSFVSPFSIACAKSGGWDLEPYHVQINIAIDASGGLAEQLANELPRHLQRRVQASLAPAWICDVHIATGLDRAKVFSTIAAIDPPTPGLDPKKDKLFLAVIRTTSDSVELTVREFDRYVERWSVPRRREFRQTSYLPEQLFRLAYETFSPLAQVELDPKDPRRVVLKPRAASLPRSAGAAPFARPGDVFMPILRRTTRGGELEKKDGLQTVSWTYIEATEVKGNLIIGRFQSASRRPIIVRRQGRIEPVAIAVRTAPNTVRLGLHSRTAA